MKGDARIIDMLNQLLQEELTAINQYMVHSEMCDNWGYARLHGKVEGRAMQEMKHAEKLISRILFLEGLPRVDALGKISIGADVGKQLASDLAAEYHAVKIYNDGINLAEQAGDAVTRNLLEEILSDENAHVDWLEAQQEQINQIGLQTYLGQQIKE